MSTELSNSSKLVNFRCPDELLSQFRSYAEKDNRSVSNAIKTLMRDAVQESKEDVPRSTASPASP